MYQNVQTDRINSIKDPTTQEAYMRYTDAAAPAAQWKTKQYLFQIRDGERRVELLNRRIRMRDSIDETDDLYTELARAKQEVKDVTVTVTDYIGRLEDVNQQMVLVKRYVDRLSWKQIAADMNMSVRAVQKLHGRALPLIRVMLEELERMTDESNFNKSRKTGTDQEV